jgi:transcriptional regulator with XRE-family HTH domain
VIEHDDSPFSLYGLTPPPVPNLGAMRAAARAIRESSPGLTIDVLAARSGLSRNAVLNLLNGQRDGGITSWHHLAHGLDVSLADLVKHLDN